MSKRMTWQQAARSGAYRGLWVAIDNCRYDQANMQPIEGDVVDSDEDLAVLCGRMRASDRGSCAILFCSGDVLVQRLEAQRPPAGLRSSV